MIYGMGDCPASTSAVEITPIEKVAVIIHCCEAREKRESTEAAPPAK
jgi:hypothetical protein